MNYLELYWLIIQLLWLPIGCMAFGICMLCKVIHDEIEYRKWKKEQK